MMLRHVTNWQRGGLVSLLLVLGLTVAVADFGRSADDTKKPSAEKKADDKAKSDVPVKPADKTDDKSSDKPADKPADKPEVREIPIGAPSGGHPATDLINKELAKFWAANSVRPSHKASDYEFCRRVYLDILGRIPAVWEIKQYIADSDTKNKRAKLINKLLNDNYYKEDFERYWADAWTTLLLTRTGNEVYHEQMEDWLEEQFGKNKPYDEMVRSLLTATGKTDENGAVNFILAHLGEPQQNRQEEGQFDAVPITSRSIRLFLGTRIQCTQCHDHPFNPEWKQGHFWGINAFFRQVERDGQPAMANQRNQMAVQLTLKENDNYNRTQTVYYENRQAVVRATSPKFLDGKTIPGEAKKSRREMLADFIIEDPNFAKAAVNRMWGHFFGRGLCQQPSVDDFGEHNPVVHPEILDGLAKNFKDYKYNLKELIAWICNSEAYELSSTANSTNAKPEHEAYFSRMLLKNMSPEQLFDSLRTALDQPEPIKKKTAPVASKKGNGQPARVVDEARKNARKAWMAKLTKNFGDDEGNEITFNGTVVQALLLMNGKELQGELSRKDNNTIINVAAKGKDTSGIINELFLAALGRTVKPEEKTKLMKLYTNNMQFYEDVFWALLNCDEFILNH